MHWCRLLLAIVVWTMCFSGADAGPARIGGDPMRDVRQTIQARKLLAEDPDLAPWNIGVIVRDRVATLWGPVPSAEVAFRAELCLKTMIELAEVRNELFVSDHVKPMRKPLRIDNPPSPLPLELPPILPRSPRLLEPIPDPAPASPPAPPIPLRPSPAPVEEPPAPFFRRLPTTGGMTPLSRIDASS